MNETSFPYVDRVRQPEYTGENRCIPCTAVNLLIAVVAAIVVATVSTGLAVATFVIAVAAIYFRGYLVPGTPTITKRYFPDRVLRLFDKHDSTVSDADIEPEHVLLDAGIVEPCMDGADLCLTSDFESEWQSEIESLREADASESRLSEVLGVDGPLTVEERTNAYVVFEDGMQLTQWESEAALLADLAAEPLLADASSVWQQLSGENRSRVLVGLRAFLEDCPSCHGEISFTQNTVESCCRSYDVVAVVCEGCDARLLEVKADNV